MSDLSPKSQALFQAAREDFAPDASDRARVERALTLRLGVAVGSVAGTASAASASIAPAAGATGAAAGAGTLAGAGSSSLLVAVTKWAGAAALAGTIAAGTVTVYRAAHVPPVSTPQTTQGESEAPKSNPLRAVSPPQAGVPPGSPPQTVVPPGSPQAGVAPLAYETPNVEPVATVLHPLVSQVARPSAPESRGTVADETRLLRDADGALRGADPARALVFIDEHARKYPDGVLKEERTAERVFALCKLGRIAEARAEAVAFLRANGESPLAQSVRDSCGLEQGPSHTGP